MYLQLVRGFEQHTGNQVSVSPQLLDTLLCGRAEHLHTLSRGTEQESAAASRQLKFTGLSFVGMRVN